MQRAQRRDAVLSEKFYFRKDIFPPGSTPSSASSNDSESRLKKERKLRNCYPSLPKPANGYKVGPVQSEYEEMTLQEIMNGKVRFKAIGARGKLADFVQGDFPGLLGLVNACVDLLDVSFKTKQRLRKYLSFIQGRANGMSWMCETKPSVLTC